MWREQKQLQQMLLKKMFSEKTVVKANVDQNKCY